MDQLDTKDLPIIQRAVEQYRKVIEDLVKNQDIKNKMDLLSDRELTEFSQRAMDMVGAMNGNYRYDLIYSNKDFVCDALDSYSRYLEALKISIYDVIGVTPKFSSIEQEIEAVNRIKRILYINAFHDYSR